LCWIISINVCLIYKPDKSVFARFPFFLYIACFVDDKIICYTCQYLQYDYDTSSCSCQAKKGQSKKGKLPMKLELVT
jgi:hypothetical protein